jgi:carbonic anhydrase
MKKLLDGIRDFHERVRPSYREKFAHLALGQAPDCLFIACSDSRVVPNLFASTDPGDLFVLRNVGNIVPPASATRGAVGSGAAVEFATLALQVENIVVCGHSSCGAMRAALTGERPEGTRHLNEWLEYAEPSLTRLGLPGAPGSALPPEDQLSQVHVLQQLEHLRTYPAVAARLAAGKLRLHAWWFDLLNAEVLAFEPGDSEFLPLVR